MASTPPDPENLAATPAPRLVCDLDRRFRESVHRALQFELDGSVASLAVVDHYLSLARDESRAPILGLLAAGAGAYFGELVRRHLGGLWLGDGSDPRKLRLLLTAEFVYFAPVDVALAAILGEEPDPEDPRSPDGVEFDAGLHLRTKVMPLPNPRTDPPTETEPPDADPSPQPQDDGSDDTTWISTHLEQLSPVPKDQFYSLTTRYETLELMLQLLASRRALAGYDPYTYTLDDYLQAFS